MKCFYHHDLDGRGAGSIVKLKEGNSITEKDFIEVDYVTEFDYSIIEKNEIVYLVDYSFKSNTRSWLDKILKKTDNVIWIDHHASSIKFLEEFPEYSEIKGIREIGISGAALTYMYLFNKESIEECPTYIQYISDYDCWQKKYEESDQFKFGMELQDQHPCSRVWIKLMKEALHIEHKRTSVSPFLNSVIKDGIQIQKYTKIEYKEYLKMFGFECELDGYKCLAVNRKNNSFIFGDRINDYDIVCTFYFNGEKYIYSIFTAKDDVDCEKIASHYFGGGHNKAAGFTTYDNILFKDKIFEYCTPLTSENLENLRKSIFEEGK